MSEILNELDRNLLLKLSWFPPDNEIIGIETRSLSLASHQWVSTVGLRCLIPDADLSPADELAELQAYVWAHTAPVRLVGALAWSGDWRDALESDEVMPPEQIVAVLAEWREIREQILGLIAVTEIDFLKRKSKGDKTPSEVAGVTRFAHKVTTVQARTGFSRKTVLWELPIWEANQIYHSAMRSEGHYTVPAFEKTSADDFDEFSIAALEDDGGADE